MTRSSLRLRPARPVRGRCTAWPWLPLCNSLLLSALVLVLAACGGQGNEAASEPSPTVTVQDALERGDGHYAVTGALFVEDDTVRLCGAIAESYPPQCGRPWVVVEGLDLSRIDLQQAEGNDVRWSESVTVEGELDGDRLVVSTT
jgi:hypothetical protein